MSFKAFKYRAYPTATQEAGAEFQLIGGVNQHVTNQRRDFHHKTALGLSVQALTLPEKLPDFSG